MEPIEDPRNASLNKAYKKHSQSIVKYVRKDGRICGHIGARTGAAYDPKFNGKTLKKIKKREPEIDIDLFVVDEEGFDKPFTYSS